jgi:hypothetical protein
MTPNTPQDPEIPSPEQDPEMPIDTPQEVPERNEPDWHAPGAEDTPMRMPRDNPDVETEI